MKTFTIHNRLSFPRSVVLNAAREAAFGAVAARQRAEEDLAKPTPTRPVTAIHRDVIDADRLASRLNTFVVNSAVRS
jgi:hypothetical protein